MPDQIDLSKMETVPFKQETGFVRLNRYWQEPSPELWDGIWQNTNANSYWKSALEGKLNAVYKHEFETYLKPNGTVLEAGCGLGQVVIALRALGYACHGLDFAEEVINLLQNRFPEVPFVRGDIRHLPYPDNFFDNYISLGVIEHFQDGQQLMLNEASRVLKPAGHAIITVPAINGLRKKRIARGRYRETSTLPFFESCISLDELCDLLNNCGMKVLEHKYFNPIMTFVQETQLRPLYRLVEDRPRVRGVVDRFLNLALSKRYFGHTLMVVANKAAI